MCSSPFTLNRDKRKIMTMPLRIRLKPLYDRGIFYAVKLPFVYIAVPIGLLFEYVIMFPYIVMTAIDARSKRKKSGLPKMQ